MNDIVNWLHIIQHHIANAPVFIATIKIGRVEIRPKREKR